LFEDVLNGHSRAKKSYSIGVHRLQQAPARTIDTGNTLQVNRDPAVRLLRMSSVPTVFELGHEGPGYPPFDLQYQLVVELFHLNLHHRLNGSRPRFRNDTASKT
jgi:hypothetical protein